MRVTSVNKRFQLVTILVLSFVLLLPLIAQRALATTISVLEGQVSLADTQNTINNSNGTVTATAKGSLWSKKTNTITITNETENKATLAFDYTVDKASSFTIGGASSSTSGTYSQLLEPGGQVTVTITSNSGFSNLTVTLKLSNFNLTVAADNSNVTINYDSGLGSVTADGESVASGSVRNVSSANGVPLVATPASGAKFLGWVDADGKILNTAATYTLKPAADMTIKAVFAKDGGTPWVAIGAATQKSVRSGLLGMSKIYYYTVSTAYLFDDLNAAAAAAAASSTNKSVVLLNSGTLPAGTYTIPAGVTLLIPFDAANTLYTEQVENTGSYTKPTAYRTLTMADGANLVINGSMSLSAKQRYAAGNKTDGGSPTGACSFVRMQGSSSITVNDGGTLYAYGFITGSGTVTANSGSSVYECFQFMDFRGGTQSTDMDNGVFPLSQYYVQNIEVPMTIHSGAQEFAYTTIYMSKADFGSNIKYIGPSDCMFNLISGYVIKQYNGTKDRLEIELYGEMTVSSVEMSVGTSSINSKDYELPINGNITLTVCDTSKVSMGQDLALLPGAEIIIEEGASVTINNGINVYVYDVDQWGTFCGAGNKTVIPITYAPGKTYTRTEADLKDAKIMVNGTLDASAGYLYTTAGGANIISEGCGIVKMKAGTQTITHQLVQGTGYTEIPLTPAKLQNYDGSYVETSSATSVTTYAYCQEHMAWVCGNSEKGVVNFATNVELGNSLNMYFAFWSDNVTITNGHKVVVSHTDWETKETKTVEFPYEKWQITDIKVSGTTKQQNAYVVYYKGMSAKQMGDVITVTLCDSSGNVVDTWSNSIHHYAMRMLSMHNDNETLRTLIVDMLNYGAACQNQFNYDTGNLVNAGLSAEQQSWATGEITIADKSTKSDYHNSSNLVLAGNIQFVVAFNNSAAINKIEYTFANHWYDGDNGHPVGEAVTRDEWYYGEGTFSNKYLVVADARQMIKITVYDKNGTELGNWEDSIESYCARIISNESATDAQKAVCTAFMKFSDAAEAYLEGGNRV